MNENPCGNCRAFDEITLGDGTRRNRVGRCAIKSKYPAQEEPGQEFPPGVARVAPGKPAEPFIVRRDLVVDHCADFRSRE
jgi:hypothetical protein